MQAIWNNPIVYRHRLLEQREYSKSKASFWIKQMMLVWCVLVPLAWVALMAFPGIMDCLAPTLNLVTLGQRFERLVQNWQAALCVSHFIVLFMAIGMALNSTASLVTGEREKKTFESLQATMLSPVEIVSGRALAGLWPVLRELTIVSPLALGLGILSGSGFEALLCICLLYSSVFFYGLVGLWSSYCCRNTQQAGRLAAGISASLLVGIPVLSGMTGEAELLKLHPIFASFQLQEGLGPVILVTAFHVCAAALLWLDSLRRERSAVRL